VKKFYGSERISPIRAGFLAPFFFTGDFAILPAGRGQIFCAPSLTSTKRCAIFYAVKLTERRFGDEDLAAARGRRKI
jgi:hypothetical protein